MSDNARTGDATEARGELRRHPLRLLAHEYKWIHTGLGLLGNLTFVVGSVMFLYESTKHAGTWLFIVGSTGMLIGSIGDAFVEKERS